MSIDKENIRPTHITNKEWYYFHIELVVDPDFQQGSPSLFNSMEVDNLTWKTLIGNSLKTLHGIRGDACHFDILDKPKSKPVNRVIIRTQLEDKELFITSLTNYTFWVGSHLGSEFDTDGYLKINKQALYLGLLLNDF